MKQFLLSHSIAKSYSHLQLVLGSFPNLSWFPSCKNCLLPENSHLIFIMCHVSHQFVKDLHNLVKSEKTTILCSVPEYRFDPPLLESFTATRDKNCTRGKTWLICDKLSVHGAKPNSTTSLPTSVHYFWCETIKDLKNSIDIS